MNESGYLKICLNLIEEKVNWGPRKGWTTYNFARFSDEIKAASGITLSTRTLRRLCDNYKSYKPQAATKTALAIYLGYTDWEDFKKGVSGPYPPNGNPVFRFKRNFKQLVSNSLRNVWFYVLILVLTFFVLSIVFYPKLMTSVNSKRVEFTSNYVIGTAPQRITFFYDVSRVNSSNIFINENFYDDGNIIPINKNRHYFTTDFELPDHYSVKILANGERLSCVRIHVITNGWEGIINKRLIGRIANDFTSGTLLHHADSIAKYAVTSGEDNIIEYRNIRDFNVLGDDMSLETEIRNLPDSLFGKCLESTIQLITLHGRVGFSFVKEGCPASLLNAEFGDVLLNGEFQDLKAFYQDFSQWRKVRITVKNKHIYVFLEDKEIYSVKYSDPLDEIKGLAFKFKGLGEISYVKLFNGEETLVYEDDF